MKNRLYKIFQRITASMLCICMVLSLFAGFILPQNGDITDVKAASGDANEYADETLEKQWEDENYKNASRPYYACAGTAASSNFGNFGGIEKRTIFHVYAFEGDTICIGSSVFDSGLDLNHKLTNGSSYNDVTQANTSYNKKNDHKDKDSVDVIMTDLNGTKHAIDIRNSEDEPGELNTTGYIDSPDMELAALKMQRQSDGTYKGSYKEKTYIPYTYKVHESGVYTFEFHSFDKAGTTNPAGKYKRSDQWPTSDSNYIGKNSTGTAYYDTGGMIAALNLTVFNESGVKQTGRTYADFLSLQMGDIGDGVHDSYYVLTSDSYIYKMQFNGATPYTYNFFANNRGVYDSATGEIVYQSVKDISNSNQFPKMGSYFKYPGTKDTETGKGFYIFLEYPDDDLYGHLYEKALQPDPATNIRFVDTIEIEGEKVPGSYVGMGGYFAFDVQEATTATLRLEFKGIKDSEGNVKDYAPVEISGVVTPNSTNYFYWDGKDGNGVAIPAGDYDVNNIIYTVTTKAGEIHFPILDMENAKGGITFTRLSHIYDKMGEQLDVESSIYELTKNVIYYDETAIYYGENVASTGISEDKVTGYSDYSKYPTGPIDKFFKELKNNPNSEGRKYWQYNNIMDGGGEYDARNSQYIQNHSEIRVGDHSHTTNVIKYFDDTTGAVLKKDDINEDQKQMIEYLSSSKYPVGKSKGAGEVKANASSGQTTTDYAIANYWTFIPAKPERSKDTDETLRIIDDTASRFNMVGRVFYDSGKNGKFDDMSTSGEYLMNGVTLNLYKKTSDTSYKEDKTYVKYEADTVKEIRESEFGGGTDVYEKVGTGETTLDGNYVFRNLEYDKTNGTEYLYQVVRPNVSYDVTSQGVSPKCDSSDGTYYGYYANYAYDKDGKGKEVQRIKVGGTGVDPTKKTVDSSDNINNTVSAVDVGYYYQLRDHSLVLKKDWDASGTHPDAVVFEVSYTLKNDNGTKIWDYRTLSAITSWQSEDEYLPAKIEGSEVDNYYVSSEYYISGDYIYRHKYEYDGTLGKYVSFVGDAFRYPLASLEKQFSGWSRPADCTIKDLPDINGDGKINGNDLGAIDEKDWVKIDATDAPFGAVLDRDMRSDNTTITITNSKHHGTVEILKYYDTQEEDSNHLAGATFRIYKGKKDDVSKLIQEYEEALAKGDKAEIEAADEKVKDIQVDSATTRSNGRIAFPGLDPDETYTVREQYAPDGYRILQEYFEVKPTKDTPANTEEVAKDNEAGIYYFDADNYVLVPVGNAQADKEFLIRKRITGRAWQKDSSNEDKFTFTISSAFDATVVDALRTDPNIRVDVEESNLIGTEVIEKLTEFAENFSSSAGAGAKNKITIGYDNPYYSYTSGEGAHKVTITSSDTKVPKKGLLVVGGEDSAASGGFVSPAFCDVNFPMAGEYIFTISEDDFTGDDTLSKSERIYTVNITVKRVLNNPESSGEKTLANSHLEAEVSKVTYVDPDSGDSTPKMFAGNSPLFTNTYVPVPAKQSTTYAIEKNFTGRTDDKWLEKDKFSVRIKGEDSVTQDALANKNIVINGLKDKRNVESVSDSEWVCTFNKDNHDKLDFDSFTFQNIVFPVQYVHNTTHEVWKAPEGNPEQVSPEEGKIGDGPEQYSPQTQPVTYKLSIREDVPETNPSKGITYDTKVYYLEIVLRNVESKGSGSVEEEDGIIEEMDLTLTVEPKPAGAANNVVATCTTRQEVVEESVWEAGSKTDGVTWWYYSGGELKERGTGTPPAGAILIKKTEEHTGEHVMTINNKYNTSYHWVPKIQKILNGRKWTSSDEFEFTIECNKTAGVTMSGDKKIVIKNGSEEHTEAFGAIDFSLPGEYEFTITETCSMKNVDSDSRIESGVYKITVTATDDEDGNLNIKYSPDDVHDSLIKFENIYKDNSSDLALNVTKELQGRSWTDDDEFKFKITPDDSATKDAIDEGVLIMPSALTGSSADGYTFSINKDAAALEDKKVTKSLGNIRITKGDDKPKTYKFKIKETDIADNVICDESSFDLWITVERKTGTESTSPTGDLKIVATFAHTGDTPAAGDDEMTEVTIPFVNTIYTDEVSDPKITNIAIKKQITGRDWTNDDTYTVNVEPEKTSGMNMDYIVYDGTTSYNGKDTESFSLTFNKAGLDTNDGVQNLYFAFPGEGEYTFNVSEVIPGVPDSYMNYDENKYTVVFKVTDKKDGTFDIEKTIKKNGVEISGGSSGEIIFDNIAIGNLDVSKTVEGDGDHNKEFGFLAEFKFPDGVEVGENVSYSKNGGSLTGTENGVLPLEKSEDASGAVTYTCNFKLAHGQTITFTGLPGTTDYTIQETERSGYNVNPANDTAKIIAGTVQKASFVNSRAALLPFAGGAGSVGGIVMITGIILLVVSVPFAYIKLRKRRKRI